MTFKKILKKGIAAISIVIVLVIAIYFFHIWWLVHSFFQDGGFVSCGQNMVTESTSPNGDTVASTFIGSCGASSPFFTSVNIRDRSDSFIPDKNGIIENGRVFFCEGEQRINFSWESNSELLIKFSQVEKAMKKTKWHNVSIEYQLLEE